MIVVGPSMPIYARPTARTRQFKQILNQDAANATSPMICINKKILQIADRSLRPRTFMEHTHVKPNDRPT